MLIDLYLFMKSPKLKVKFILFVSTVILNQVVMGQDSVSCLIYIFLNFSQKK